MFSTHNRFEKQLIANNNLKHIYAPFVLPNRSYSPTGVCFSNCHLHCSNWSSVGWKLNAFYVMTEHKFSLIEFQTKEINCQPVKIWNTMKLLLQNPKNIQQADRLYYKGSNHIPNLCRVKFHHLWFCALPNNTQHSYKCRTSKAWWTQWE